MSSMAKMLEGSLMAMMSELPARFTGTTWCFSAVARGMSRMTSSSISKSLRPMAGTPYCLERKLVSSASAMEPCFTRSDPMRPPPLRCSSWAFWSCCREMRFSRTSSSPSRPDIARGLVDSSSGGRCRDCSRRLVGGSRKPRPYPGEITGRTSERHLHRLPPEDLPGALHVAPDLDPEVLHRGKTPLLSEPVDEGDADPVSIEIAPVAV